MPPLNPWHTMPVPPPTAPSGGAPAEAPSRPASTCSGFTWKPLASFKLPSQVSATTGSHHGCRTFFRESSHWMIASRTTPTLWVLVIATGPSRSPLSSTQVVPVISPLPLRVNQAAKTGSAFSLPRGWITVTPGRTGPFPPTSFPLPRISVVWPTSTPATSVMASSGPAVPPIGSLRSRSRGFWACNASGKARAITNARRRGILSSPDREAGVYRPGERMTPAAPGGRRRVNSPAPGISRGHAPQTEVHHVPSPAPIPRAPGRARPSRLRRGRRPRPGAGLSLRLREQRVRPRRRAGDDALPERARPGLPPPGRRAPRGDRLGRPGRGARPDVSLLGPAGAGLRGRVRLRRELRTGGGVAGDPAGHFPGHAGGQRGPPAREPAGRGELPGALDAHAPVLRLGTRPRPDARDPPHRGAGRVHPRLEVRIGVSPEVDQGPIVRRRLPGVSPVLIERAEPLVDIGQHDPVEHLPAPLRQRQHLLVAHDGRIGLAGRVERPPEPPGKADPAAVDGAVRRGIAAAELLHRVGVAVLREQDLAQPGMDRRVVQAAPHRVTGLAVLVEHRPGALRVAQHRVRFDEPEVGPVARGHAPQRLSRQRLVQQRRPLRGCLANDRVDGRDRGRVAQLPARKRRVQPFPLREASIPQRKHLLPAAGPALFSGAVHPSEAVGQPANRAG